MKIEFQLSGRFGEHALLSLIQRLLPDAVLRTRARLLAADIRDGVTWDALCDVSFDMTHQDWELPTRLELCFFRMARSDEPLIRATLARQLSLATRCRVLCRGEGFADSSSRHWVLMFIDGQAVLADDSAVSRDQVGKPTGSLHLLRAIPVPRLELDGQGRLIDPEGERFQFAREWCHRRATGESDGLQQTPPADFLTAMREMLRPPPQSTSA